MTTSNGPTSRSKTSTGAGRGSKTPPRASTSIRNPELLTLTINAKTWQIVKLEGVDSSGARRELSQAERTRLAQEKGADTLETLIEEAFEAGIASVLGDRAGQFGPSESEEEAELRHLLLQPLIDHSPARHLMKRDTLTRATMGTLLRQHLGRLPQNGEGGASEPHARGSASKVPQSRQSPERHTSTT